MTESLSRSTMISKNPLNALIVNWGTEDQAKFPLQESLKLGKYDIFLATTKHISRKIKKMFTPNHLIYTNPYNGVKLLEDVVKFSTQYKVNFDVVTTFFEMNVYEAAIAAEYLQCKRFLSPTAALRTSANKYLMRTYLTKSRILQPRYGVFYPQAISESYRFLSDFNASVVVKPFCAGHSYGARLISKNTSREKFQYLVSEAVEEFNFYFSETDSKPKEDMPFLMEEFIPGNIYSIDGVVREDNDITIIGNAEFEMIDPPLLQQIGHTAPIAALNQKQIDYCQAFTRMVIKKLGLQYCGFHCELKYYQNKPWLIEIGARLPGGDILRSYQAISKYNIFDIFWSAFEDKKIFQLQKRLYASQSRTMLFINRNIFYIKQAPKTSYVSRKDYICKVQVKNGPGIVCNPGDIFGGPLLRINMYSDSLSASALKKKRNEILQELKLKFKIKNVSRIYLQFHFMLNKFKKIIKLFLGGRILI